MGQYRPCWNAFRYSEIKRYVNEKEINEAIDYATKLGLNFII